jgi:hypothetical protein
MILERKTCMIHSGLVPCVLYDSASGQAARVAQCSRRRPGRDRHPAKFLRFACYPLGCEGSISLYFELYASGHRFLIIYYRSCLPAMHFFFASYLRCSVFLSHAHQINAIVAALSYCNPSLPPVAPLVPANFKWKDTVPRVAFLPEA